MFDRAAFQRAFSSAGRRLGDGAHAARVELMVEAAAQLAGFAGGAGGRPRGIDERSESAGGGGPAGFAGGAGLRPRGIDELVAFVEDCFRTGDNDERRAVLDALDRLPAPERFVPLAVSACRTNVVPVFEAIACDNPFAARHFPEAAFNQLVLKALFIGVAIDRIAGLADRITPELVRMAAGYAAERRAAGRPVSTDTERLANHSVPRTP